MAQGASATHPPTSRDLEPYWQVGEWRERLPPPTHLPVGKTPLVGVLPYYSVGRTQKPLSHKLTPTSLPPYSMFMTEVTSMGGGSDYNGDGYNGGGDGDDDDDDYA